MKPTILQFELEPNNFAQFQGFKAFDVARNSK